MKQLTPARKGLITGALMVVASAFSLFVLKNPVESSFQFVVYILFLLGIIWSMVAYSKQSTGKLPFKDYFLTGFKTFIVVTLMMTLFTYIYFNAHPEFRDSKIDENSRLLIAQGDHLPKEIEENTKQLKKMFMPMMLSAAVFRYLILGAIISAITAGFLNNSKKVA